MKNPLDSKILVTGGAGFIGSALVWRLNELGYTNILVSDRLDRTEKFKNLIPLRFKDYIEADTLLERVHNNDPALKDIGCVFHLGACSSTTETDGHYLINNNYEYTKSMARWALAHSTRFLYASSAATYGDGSHGMDDTTKDLNQYRPLNMYGYSKHLFDIYAQQEGFLDKIIGLKYFNVFGPNEAHKGDMRSVIHKAFSQIKTEGKMRLFKSYKPEYKDGEQKRDFLYVKDTADMTLHLAQTPKAGGLHNIGSGLAHTWMDVAHGLFAAMNLQPKIEFIDMPETLRSKYQYFTCANIDKLRATGYQKEITPLKDAIKDYVQNYIAVDKFLGEEKSSLAELRRTKDGE